MRTLLLLSLIAAAFLGESTAQAEQYTRGGNVVHTRRLPVVAHRIVPPFRGVHVYSGRRR
jgi:hypothetical protein